jgi:hypothetical protein
MFGCSAVVATALCRGERVTVFEGRAEHKHTHTHTRARWESEDAGLHA